MALDRVGLNIVGELEKSLPAPRSAARRAEAVVRCRAIINALEVQIEEDAEPPLLEVVDHIGAAFVQQARTAGLDSDRASRVIGDLVDHLRRR
jgi:hypothetical protein